MRYTKIQYFKCLSCMTTLVLKYEGEEGTNCQLLGNNRPFPQVPCQCCYRSMEENV